MTGSIFSNKKGFSLLELLLVVGVFSILLAYASSIYDSWYRDSIDRKVVNEILYLQNAAEGYVNLNFERVLPPLGSIDEIDINDLIAENALPNGYSNINSHRQRMRVLISHTTDSAVNGSVVDVLTITDNPSLANVQRIPNNRLFRVAENFPEIGIVSNITLGPDCCNGTVQSLLGLWRLPLSDISGLYTTTANDDGGYLAAYGRVSIDQDIVSNYLYRVPIASVPNANTMEVNLDMGGNDIINTNAIISDAINIGGNALIEGNRDTQLNSPYVLVTTQDMIFEQNMAVESNNSEKGNVIINGDGGIGADFIVSDTLTVQLDENTNSGVVSAREMSADGINPLNIVNFRNANFNNSLLEAGNLYSSDTQYNTTLTTNNVQAIRVNNISNLTAANLVSETTNINSNSFTIPSELVIGNNLNIIGDANLTGRLNVDNDTTIYNLNNCGSGCP